MTVPALVELLNSSSFSRIHGSVGCLDGIRRETTADNGCGYRFTTNNLATSFDVFEKKGQNSFNGNF